MTKPNPLFKADISGCDINHTLLYFDGNNWIQNPYPNLIVFIPSFQTIEVYTTNEEDVKVYSMSYVA